MGDQRLSRGDGGEASVYPHPEDLEADIRSHHYDYAYASPLNTTYEWADQGAAK